MSTETENTRAQRLFLRAFRDHPTGPAPADWPNPGTFKRWLKSPRFRRSLAAVRDALRFQADLHIASAATSAAKSLQSAVTNGEPASAGGVLDPETAEHLTRQLKSLTDLLRLAHLRTRFAPPEQPAASSTRNATDHRNDDEEVDRGGPICPDGKPVGYFRCNGPPGPPGFDPPHFIAEVFADPPRLKSYMLLLALRGRPGYEQFFGGFPEDLAKINAAAARRAAGQQDTEPQPPS